MTTVTRSRITHSILISSRLIALFMVVGYPAARAQNPQRSCERWISWIIALEKGAQRSDSSQAKENLKPLSNVQVDPWGIAKLSIAEKMEAIQCLLGEENDLRPAAFGGSVRLEVSQTFAIPPANLAALYAISYFYTGHYNHASAVALRGDDASYIDSGGNYVTKPSAIHKAYLGYNAWFAKVRQIGLAKAQQTGLQPLEGTGLRWY
jgi:hypothetical protein